MSKHGLNTEFQLADAIYTMVYYPDPNDATQLQPDYSKMFVQTSGSKKVQLPTASGVVEQYLMWVKANVPSIQGSMQPPKEYFLIRLSDKEIPAELLQPHTMICFAVQPLMQVLNVEQQFINTLLNIPQAQTVEEIKETDDWAVKMFNSENTTAIVADDDDETDA